MFYIIFLLLFFWRYWRIHVGGSDGGALPRRLPARKDAGLRCQKDSARCHRIGSAGRFALSSLFIPGSRHHMFNPTWWIASLQKARESIFRSLHPVGRLSLDPRSHFQSTNNLFTLDYYYKKKIKFYKRNPCWSAFRVQQFY